METKRKKKEKEEKKEKMKTKKKMKKKKKRKKRNDNNNNKKNSKTASISISSSSSSSSSSNSSSSSSSSHCCSKPGKSARLGSRLAYLTLTDPDMLAPTMSESALRVSCSPSLLSIKNVGLQFLRSLWSFVRFRICLGMIFTTRLKETFIYHAVP